MECVVNLSEEQTLVLSRNVGKANQEGLKNDPAGYVFVDNRDYLQNLVNGMIASWQKIQQEEDAVKNWEKLKSLTAEKQAYLLSLLEEEANG